MNSFTWQKTLSFHFAQRISLGDMIQFLSRTRVGRIYLLLEAQSSGPFSARSPLRRSSLKPAPGWYAGVSPIPMRSSAAVNLSMRAPCGANPETLAASARFPVLPRKILGSTRPASLLSCAWLFTCQRANAPPDTTPPRRSASVQGR